MAISETARLIASLELKDLFTKQVDNATKSLGKLDKGIDGTQGRAYKAGTQIGTGIKRGTIIAIGAIGALTTQIALGVKSLESVEAVTAQTNAALKSTKDVSGQTAQGIRDMSNAFENLNATMDDTTIQAGANVLLTFTNIREKAFKPALQAALDLSTAMKQDLQTSVVQIGKALNDPVKGLTSLTRIGVSFTKQQKDQIKALVKTGDVLGAQRIILKELNTEFSGSFLAQGNTTQGKIAKVRDAIDDLQRTLATALLPALGKIADATSKFLNSPAVVANVKKLGEAIAGLFSDENLAKGADFLQSAFKTAMDFAPVIEASAKATLGLVSAAVNLFKSLPPEIQGLAAGAFAINKLTGGLVTNVGGAIFDQISGLLGRTRGSSPANPVFVSGAGIGGVGGPAKIAEDVGSKLPIIPIAAAFLAIVGAPFYTQWLAAHGFGSSPANDAGNQGATNAPGGGLPAGVHTGSRTPNLPGAGQFTPGTGLPVNVVNIKSGLAPTILDRGGREKGNAGIAGTITGTLNKLISGAIAVAKNGFGLMISELRNAKTGKQIEAAVKEAVRQVIGLKKGNVDATKQTVSSLKALLKKTDDPKLRSEIKAALHKVETKIPGREYAQKQIAKADALIRDGKVTRSDLKSIQAIEKDLKNRSLPHAAAVIQAKVNEKGNETVSAVHATTAAIQAQKTAITVENAVSVSLRSILNGTKVQNSFTRKTANTFTVS